MGAPVQYVCGCAEEERRTQAVKALALVLKVLEDIHTWGDQVNPNTKVWSDTPSTVRSVPATGPWAPAPNSVDFLMILRPPFLPQSFQPVLHHSDHLQALPKWLRASLEGLPSRPYLVELTTQFRPHHQ